MQNPLPKISIGRNSVKKQLMTKSFDNHTTSDFGFVQPLMCMELVPNSVLKTSLKSWVLLSPLSRPSFARISWNTYHYFVPMSSLFEPFGNLITSKPYWTHSGNVPSYVPTQVPCINWSDLTLFLLMNSAECWRLVGTKSSADVTNSYNFDTSSTRDQVMGDLDNLFKYSFYASAAQTYWKTSSILFNKNTKRGLKEADFSLSYSSGNYFYIVCFKFGRKARNLRKIFLGLGYQLSLKTSQALSILPLLAYYKAWYDLFALKRNSTWTGTDAYRLIHYCSENNDTYPTVANWHLFYDFLAQLSDCYYTQDPDYITAHRATPSNAQDSSRLPQVSDPLHLGMLDPNNSGSARTTTSQPVIAAAANISRNALIMLNRFTKMVNKESVLGQKLDDILRSRFGIVSNENIDSDYIGSDLCPCDINEVMSTAETSEAYLGEYAGKGIGENGFKEFTYDNTGVHSEFGFWVTLGCIVPSSGYIQQNNTFGTLHHLSKYDFFNPEFDALGFQVTAFDDFIGSTDHCPVDRLRGNAQSLGFIPRYSEYKCQSGNVANGDITLKSTRENMLMYTLDKYFTTDSLDSIEKADGTYQIVATSRNPEVINDSLRYIGKDLSNGNYNRIFISNNPPVGPYTDAWADTLDDNFIIHNVFDVKFIAPMKSMSDSFDTGEDENSVTDVTMA